MIDFKLPWLRESFTDLHHIAVYYLVKKVGGEIRDPEQFEGQDSLGAVWVSEKDVSLDHASPLVLKAFEWIRTKELGVEVIVYTDWEVRE